MPDPLLMILGLDNFFWARPLPAPLMIAVFLTVVLLSIYLYRRPWGLPLWLRIGLGAARLIALALVVASLFEPTAVVTETHTQERTLPVLIDVSESMSMQDQRKNALDIAAAAAALGMLSEETLEADELVMRLDADQRQAIQSASRLDLARGILRYPAAPVLKELGESFDISYHSFGRSTHILSDDDLKILTANEPATAIAASLEAVAKSGATVPAGIVLLTDGIENTSSKRIEAVLQDLGARGIPVFPMPIGLEEPDDVSIRNIVMQEVAFSGDSVPVQVQVLSKGYEKRTARLSIQLNDRQVFQRQIRLKGGLQFEDVEFNVDLYEKGAARIAVIIEPFEDEISVANNRVERSIRVVNEKVNVLYIEGNNRWEFRYLSAILKRDPRLNTTFISSSAGPEFARNSPEHIERFPSKRVEAFKYDLVILGDVDAAFFTAEELSLLEELIRDRGASLLVLCGPMHTPSSYVGTPIETIMPVRFDADSEWEMTSDVGLSGADSRRAQQHGDVVGKRDRGERPHLEPRCTARSLAAAARNQARCHGARHAFRCGQWFAGISAGRMAPLRHRQVHVHRQRPPVAPALQDRRQIPLARVVAVDPVPHAFAPDGRAQAHPPGDRPHALSGRGTNAPLCPRAGRGFRAGHPAVIPDLGQRCGWQCPARSGEPAARPHLAGALRRLLHRARGGALPPRGERG